MQRGPIVVLAVLVLVYASIQVYAQADKRQEGGAAAASADLAAVPCPMEAACAAGTYNAPDGLMVTPAANPEPSDVAQALGITTWRFEVTVPPTAVDPRMVIATPAGADAVEMPLPRPTPEQVQGGATCPDQVGCRYSVIVAIQEPLTPEADSLRCILAVTPDTAAGLSPQRMVHTLKLPAGDLAVRALTKPELVGDGRFVLCSLAPRQAAGEAETPAQDQPVVFQVRTASTAPTPAPKAVTAQG